MSATQILWTVCLVYVLSIGSNREQPEPIVRASSSDCALNGAVTAHGTQTPVEDALVALIGTETTRTTLSDKNGLFEFTQLATGQYTLVVKRPGFLDFVLSKRETLQCPGPDQTNQIVLEKGGRILGVVTDHMGDPAPGVEVVLDGSRTRTLTNAKGEYRFESVAAGEHVISATPRLNGFLQQAVTRQTEKEIDRILVLLARGIFDPGRPDLIDKPDVSSEVLSNSVVYFPGVVLPDEAVPVVLGAGEVREGVNFGFQLGRSFSVTGTVIGVNGQPSIGAVVVFGRQKGNTVVVVATEYSGPEGQFMARALPPGVYSVRVWQGSESRTLGTARDPAAVALSAAEWGDAILSVFDNVSQAVISLSGALVVTGQTTFASDSPKPADGTAMLSLYLDRLEPVTTALRMNSHAAKMGLDGRFAVTNLTPGEHKWRCVLPGYSECDVLAVQVGESQTAGSSFSVRPSTIGTQIKLTIVVRR